MYLLGKDEMLMESLIRFENTGITFDTKAGMFSNNRKVIAVSGVNLNINSGEIIAIVGESGCGKTTLGKMVAGMYKPTEGVIKFKDQDIWNLNKSQALEYRRGVQMVHQDSYAALNPARTIFQSLCPPIVQHKMAKNKAVAKLKLIELFTMVGLTPPEQFLDKYPHQLSGGQRQRILLARALSVQPKIIVADEPVSMVDVSIRISLLDLMSEMNRKFNISFIYITHDLATARYIATKGRIAVMYLGKIVETGNLNQILDNPRHPYLQALLSAVPIPDPRISRAMKPIQLKSLELPDPSNPPKGCGFNPRCPYAEKICETTEPELVDNNGELVSCHLIEKIPKWKRVGQSDISK